jgi:hypothetical protein
MKTVTWWGQGDYVGDYRRVFSRGLLGWILKKGPRKGQGQENKKKDLSSCTCSQGALFKWTCLQGPHSRETLWWSPEQWHLCLYPPLPAFGCLLREEGFVEPDPRRVPDTGRQLVLVESIGNTSPQDTAGFALGAPKLECSI